MTPPKAPLPAIGFEAPAGIKTVAQPGFAPARVVLGGAIKTPYGELVLLQQTPPILFDANRLEDENAFAAWRDWELAVALLPERDTEGDGENEGAEYYDLRDIARCLGPITNARVARHAHDLWPNYEGCYRLNFTQATKLIKRYHLAGRRRFDRDDLELLVRQKLQTLFEQICPQGRG